MRKLFEKTSRFWHTAIGLIYAEGWGYLSIRLKGYMFKGPWLLQNWVPPDGAGIFAILIKPDPVNKPNVYTVIYIEGTANFLDSRLPWSHREAKYWLKEGKIKNNIYIAIYEIPRSTREKRNQICQYLIRGLKPICNLIKS